MRLFINFDMLNFLRWTERSGTFSSYKKALSRPTSDLTRSRPTSDLTRSRPTSDLTRSRPTSDLTRNNRSLFFYVVVRI